MFFMRISLLLCLTLITQREYALADTKDEGVEAKGMDGSLVNPDVKGEKGTEGEAKLASEKESKLIEGDVNVSVGNEAISSVREGVKLNTERDVAEIKGDVQNHPEETEVDGDEELQSSRKKRQLFGIHYFEVPTKRDIKHHGGGGGYKLEVHKPHGGGGGGYGHEVHKPHGGGGGGYGHEVHKPHGGGGGGYGHEVHKPHGGGGGYGHEVHKPHGGGGGYGHEVHKPHGGGGGYGHEVHKPHGGGGGYGHEVHKPHGGGGYGHDPHSSGYGHDSHSGYKEPPKKIKSSPYKGPQYGPYDLVAPDKSKKDGKTKYGDDPVNESKKAGYHKKYDQPIKHFGGFGGGGSVGYNAGSAKGHKGGGGYKSSSKGHKGGGYKSHGGGGHGGGGHKSQGGGYKGHSVGHASAYKGHDIGHHGGGYTKHKNDHKGGHKGGGGKGGLLKGFKGLFSHKGGGKHKGGHGGGHGGYSKEHEVFVEYHPTVHLSKPYNTYDAHADVRKEGIKSSGIDVSHMLISDPYSQAHLREGTKPLKP